MGMMKNKTGAGAVDDNATKRVQDKNKALKKAAAPSKPYDSNKRMGGENANHPEKNNPVDAEMDKLQNEEDEKRGISQTLKNVWDAYTD